MLILPPSSDIAEHYADCVLPLARFDVLTLAEEIQLARLIVEEGARNAPTVRPPKKGIENHD